MTQTFALLLDSYRELNARRLFWVSLAISGLVVVLFGALGLDNGAVTALGWTTPIRSAVLAFITPEVFYRRLFVNLGVKLWLSWVAAILALISTAGIFPDLMAGGSIDLYLSKPISRLRLFVTKLAGGLLFVTLQVVVFCAGCVVALRCRTGTWEPGLFVAVPLVVLMFSYLFAVCVLVGVLTRSTIAALLLTLLFWLAVAGVQYAEVFVAFGQSLDHTRAAQLDRQIAAAEAQLQATPERPATRPATTAATRRSPRNGGSWIGNFFGGNNGGGEPGVPPTRLELESKLATLRSDRRRVPADRFDTAHAVLAGVLAPLPKTGGTIEVLERQLVKLTDLPPVNNPVDTDVDLIGAGPADAPPGPGRRRRRGTEEYAERQVDVQQRATPATWILGTSCAFEAVVLALAAWAFCRRDY